MAEDPRMNDKPLAAEEIVGEKPQRQTEPPKVRCVLIFDSENFLMAERNLRYQIAYDLVVRTLIGSRQCVGKYWFARVPGTEGQMNFLRNQAGMECICDVSKTVDAAIIERLPELSKEADIIILVSGDGDYADALDTLVGQGKRIEIVSIPEMVDNSYLRKPGYKFIDLTSFGETIKRTIPPRRHYLQASILGTIPTEYLSELHDRFYKLFEWIAGLDNVQIDYTFSDQPIERDRDRRQT